MAEQKTTYEDLIKHNPKIGDVLDPSVFDFMRNSNDRTMAALSSVWEKNARRNLKKDFRRFGLLADNCKGFGLQKSTVMIGAGPSLKNNWQYLKKLVDWNWKFPFEQQPFLFVTCNHQFKKCVEDGIIPHFVVLVDASDSNAIYKQMCEGLPEKAYRVALFAAIHINPAIVRHWSSKSASIQFYIPSDPENLKLAESITGEDYSDRALLQGGNVSNVAWMASLAAFDSRIFMALGNDLSYDIDKDVKKRRNNYYHDGDYSSNMASGRDEAEGMKNWLGFKMRQSALEPDRPVIDWKLKGTTHSLFSYKTWLETNVAIQDISPASFHYYNCSEEGILGMTPKSYDVIDLNDPKKWVIMDEILPRRWKTRTFRDAVEEYLTSRELCLIQAGIQTGVGAAGNLLDRTGGARIIAPGQILTR